MFVKTCVEAVKTVQRQAAPIRAMTGCQPDSATLFIAT
jgi:hypothetical protein